MQNNDNQTNQKDPHNRGQNGFEHISPGLCSIWLGLSDLFQTFEDLESVVDKEAEIASIRELLDVDDPQQTDEKEPLC